MVGGKIKWFDMQTGRAVDGWPHTLHKGIRVFWVLVPVCALMMPFLPPRISYQTSNTSFRASSTGTLPDFTSRIHCAPILILECIYICLFTFRSSSHRTESLAGPPVIASQAAMDMNFI